MISHRRSLWLVLALAAATAACAPMVIVAPGVLVGGQQPVDSATILRIREEAIVRSKVMETLGALTDVYGPRLTGSPGFKRAAEWARDALTAWGLRGARIEDAGPFGQSWTLRRFSARLLGPQPLPLIAYPKAWSPSTAGVLTGDVVFLDETAPGGLEGYRGRLKGKVVLLFSPPPGARFEPSSPKMSDAELRELAEAKAEPQSRRIEFDPFTQGFWSLAPRDGRGRRFDFPSKTREQLAMTFRKMALCQEEGAAVILWPGAAEGGNLIVEGARVPTDPDTPLEQRLAAFEPRTPEVVRQLSVASEHYNRIFRMLKRGLPLRLELDLDADSSGQDSVYNVLAEIPGTDLKEEIVMLGAHLDSWHGGTGATDNGAGVAVCMEAMRLLEALKLKPRRTIRLALWGGEEQGAIGSKAYVKRHLGGSGAFLDPGEPIAPAPEAGKLSVYFNLDKGAGRIRGLSVQGDEPALPIFRSWLAAFSDWGASTVTLSNSYGSDHLSFDALGIPAFQFLQDPMEDRMRAQHATMDLYERAQEEDLKQAAAIVAALAYQSAMRPERIPRRPL